MMASFIYPHTTDESQTIKKMGIVQSFDFLCETITPKETDVLKEMKYVEFLNTIYWFVVARYKKHGAHICGECHSDGVRFHTHHTTYEHHGLEHLHLEDLVNVCEECHLGHHAKTNEYLALMKRLIDSHKVESIKAPVNPNYDSLVIPEMVKELENGDR